MYLHVCIYTKEPLYVCGYIHIYVHIYICTYIYVCAHVFLCVHLLTKQRHNLVPAAFSSQSKPSAAAGSTPALPVP